MILMIVSVIAGGVVSFFIAKWQMKKNKIAHFVTNTFDIGKGLTKIFPNFQLQYNGENLTNDVRVLAGGFMNLGRNDICTPKGDITSIQLILPQGCIVKDVNTKTSSKGLNITPQIDSDIENVINFNISNLFKTDEYFQYIAIVEMPKDTGSLLNKLKFNHRIPNTENIQSTYIGLEWKYQRHKFLRIFMYLLMIMLVCFSFHMIWHQELGFKVYDKTTSEEVFIYTTPKSKIYVVDGNQYLPYVYSDSISVENLNNNYRIAPVTKFQWLHKDIVSLVVLWGFSLGTLGSLFYRYWIKNRHILKVLNNTL